MASHEIHPADALEILKNAGEIKVKALQLESLALIYLNALIAIYPRPVTEIAIKTYGQDARTRLMRCGWAAGAREVSFAIIEVELLTLFWINSHLQLLNRANRVCPT